MNVAVATRMTVDEIGVALALFCKLHGADPRLARGPLDPTPRLHFDAGREWADANERLIRLIAEDPRAVAAGSYSMASAGGWLSRIFGRRGGGVSAPVDAEIEQVMGELTMKKRDVDADKAQRLAKLRELVDESFDAG